MDLDSKIVDPFLATARRSATSDTGLKNGRALSEYLARSTSHSAVKIAMPGAGYV